MTRRPRSGFTSLSSEDRRALGKERLQRLLVIARALQSRPFAALVGHRLDDRQPRAVAQPDLVGAHGQRRPRGDDLGPPSCLGGERLRDRKSTRLNSSHSQISYAVFCLKKKKK